MRKNSKFAAWLFLLWAMLRFASTAEAQITFTVYFADQGGIVPVTGYSGSYTVSNVFAFNSGKFSLPTNSSSPLLFQGGTGSIQYGTTTYTLTITNLPSNIVLSNSTVTGSLNTFNATANVTVTFGIAQEPAGGTVYSDGVGLPGVTISGTAAGQTVTDSNGNYSFSKTTAQTFTATKTGVVFTSPSQTFNPGFGVNFNVNYATISGQINGPGGSGAMVKVVGASPCTNPATATGIFTSCPETATSLCTVTPANFGYHFTPAAISNVPPGASGLVFSSASVAVALGDLANVNLPENQGTFTNAIYSNIAYGDVPATNVILSVSSSNPSLIPNTPASIGIVGAAPEQSIVFTPIPGATGTSTITITLNDTLNTPVSKTFVVSITSSPQVPVAGMPVALNFNGANNLVRVPNFAAQAPTTEVTVEFWENVAQVAQQSTLIMGSDNPTNRFNIYAPYIGGSYGAVYWDFGNTLDGSGRISYALPSSITNKWTHFAFVSSQTANGGLGLMQIYENGNLVASKVGGGSFTNYTDDLLIGAATSGFSGAISDLRVWNIALNASNVLRTMNNPLIGSEPGLVLYYRFNENSGTTIHDSSPAGLSGLVQGDAPYPTWVPAPTNFQFYAVTSASTSNLFYLPGYIQDQPSSKYAWSLADASHLRGTLTEIAGGEWNYVPAGGSAGSASFTYAVSSGSGTLTNTAVVNILVASLNPPVISPIPNQLVLANSSSTPILFSVTDTNTPVDQLVFNEVCDNPDLQPTFQLTLVTNNGNTNAIMSLVITPPVNSIGSGNVTVSVNDAHNTASQSFVLEVNQRPAYTIVDLGVLSSRFASYGMGINSAGQAVGYCTDGTTVQNEKQAFLYTGFSQGGGLVALQTNFSLSSAAYGINDQSQITGSAELNGGDTSGFFYDYLGAQLLVVNGYVGGTSGAGLSINNQGYQVGFATTSYDPPYPTYSLAYESYKGDNDTDVLSIPGQTNAATSINDSGEVVGYYVTNGLTNAFVYNATNFPAVTYPGYLPGGTNSAAYAVNNAGDVAGVSYLANGFPHPWLKSSSGSMTDLGIPSGAFGATAYGLNNFDQVVGTTVTTNGNTHAFLYSSGQMYDLNSLIPYEETNTWVLKDARGINDSGAIVGTGVIGGQTHAFVALPAWVSGQPIPRPLGAIAQPPETTVISGPTTSASPFYWDLHSQQLYAIVPCTAEIQWPTSIFNQANPTNTTPPIVQVSKVVWPRPAQTHVANAPVEVVPKGLPANLPFNYSFQSVMYSTSLNAGVDQNNVFTCPTNAYTVLRYISVSPDQTPPYPLDAPSVFQVVRTVSWNDPYYLLNNNVPVTIGSPITNATHFDYAGRNGYVLFPKSVFDGLATDQNRSYDRPTRLGPIIPVNTINTALTVPDQPLAVVWYHTNNIGVAWGDTPYNYLPNWPATTDPTNTIVIASHEGSGGDGLPANYVSPFVYAQNDQTQAGFNPNEEHALIVGGVLFALRNDLNSLYGNLSQPYVLLKYQDAANNNQWTMRVFSVVATNNTYSFVYPGLAGTQIQPPLPLSAMQLCTTSNTGTAGPFYHAKVDGSLWATAAGPDGTTTNIVLHYWYPLQAGFYYSSNVSVGTCIPWLDHGGGTPVDVTYVIAWPETFVMPVGQTLTTAANGLPDITDLPNASIIYDSLNPSGGSSITNLARLYDPFSARSLPVPSTATWPTTMTFDNVNGLYQFANLPYYLRLRLIYDPINNLLSFQGLMADTTPGAAQILLNNVMSIREREEIKSLDGGTDTTDFDQLVDLLYKLTRNPNMLTLSPAGISTNHFDDALLIGLTAQTNFTYTTNHTVVTTNSYITIVPQSFGGNPKALTTGMFGVPPPQPVPPGSTNYPPEYITVVCDDPITGAPVQMYVIQVSGGPATGSLAVLPGDNAFDQRLTMRHTDDFGGDPDPFQFQYFYFAGDNNGIDPLKTSPPTLNADGSVQSLNGWLQYAPPNVLTDTNGSGANDITLGEGGQSGLLVMSDNWFISRYTGYNIDGATNWSGWIGAPGGGAQLAEGWITRVLAGLNPFDARTSDFHTDPIDTYQSIIEQAGAPYAGPIALNSDPTYINSIGLIQAYQTVLEIGESLSINGTPPVDYPPANQALQLAASKISSLEVSLGNEAYAEFSDPTVGFSTGGTYGSLASSIFAFEDQVDTLLDQELDLLHGRDDTATSVRATPVFNRLYWNFTGGNGQVAYVSTFDVTDVNGDGFINTADAEVMFPQGHGDAWGYYLSALTPYYGLLQNPNFDWVPRASAVLVGGVPVQVNYQDEQAFAHAAAAKAQTGANIIQLTYESAYVADPSGQYQGYEDTDTNRAWGLSEWGRRAGQGAFFDWVTVNAVLPAVDPNPADVGLAKVDRTTVSDISAIPASYVVLQNELDQADAGLNPLGLAKQSVPFDIDPTLIDAGETHFEQIYGRAVSAMQNAVAVWDQANEFTSALRQQQDTEQQFSQNVASQDQDFQSRLIEVFGYPYAGDIGQPGSAYPQGYSGPDLYHYMYVDMSTYDTAVLPPSSAVTATYTPLSGPNTTLFLGDVPSSYPLTTNSLTVNFPISTSENLFQPPASWGSRQAPGEIQNTLNTLLQDKIRLQEAVANYNALLVQVQNSVTLLQAHFNLNTANANIENTASDEVVGLQATATALSAAATGMTATATIIDQGFDVALKSVPTVEGLADDALAPLRGTIMAVDDTVKDALTASAAVSTAVAAGMQQAAQLVQSEADSLVAANTQGYEMQQEVAALQNLIQQEPALRLECFNQRETIVQDLGNYEAALAKGEQILQARCTFAQQSAAQVEAARYQDMTFRIFQNDAIQKYEAQFALAKQYVYMAAIAYDFETDLLGSASGSGQSFLTSIIQEQSLGEMDNGNPVVGVTGLAGPLAKLGQNFAVLKGQLGFNNPQTETGKFSLRYGLFRQQSSTTNAIPINGTFTNDWQTELKKHVVPDLWQVPEFVRYCRPFAPKSAGAQPGLVISFGTTITYGLNFFGWPLAGGDSAYDPTLFTTKVRSVGVWFDGYDNSGLSTTPRIYLIPVGNDMMRSPTDGQTVRSWRVQDQAIPVPFPLDTATLSAPNYIPVNNSLSGTMNKIRQFSSFLGYTDQGAEIDPTQVVTDSRQIGRSVWNSQWMLVIPGGTLLNDPNAGLQDFINSVSDIKIFFQTYSYSGN